ncbi:MAG: DNA polymerase III subunit delta' [Thermodesulfobacteriota bacterium]
MSFDEIKGHERPLRLIKAMLAAGRLPHALLLSGPAGVGKRTLALALAQAVNCLNPRSGEPCGVCLSCDKIIRGLHPDVEEIAPEGKARLIKIESVRDLRTRIAYKPYEGRCKVFIVREADRMKEEQANALLKTLEEPPPQSLLILTTPEESDLLPTMVSRCLRLSLAPLPRALVEDWLKMRRGLMGPRARLLASMSGGCLGRVKDVSPDEFWNRRQEIVSRLGTLDARRLEPALKWAAELAAGESGWPDLFSLLRFWYRDLMILSGIGGEERLMNQDLAGQLKTAAAGRRCDDFRAALAAVDRAEDALNRFIRPELVFENLLLALAEI